MAACVHPVLASGRRSRLVAGRGLGRRRYTAPASSLEHCTVEVQRADTERYLCNLFLPVGPRAHAFAVHALNAELSRVREAVSDRTIRRMRLQWWREALELASRGKPQANPVAQAVAGALANRPLIFPWLSRLVQYREADLEIELQPADMAWVEDYADGTAGSLLHCAMELVGDESDEAHAAADAVGRAHGLVTLLRGTPHHAAMGYTFLPRDVTAAHGLNLGDLLAGRRPVALRGAVEQVADAARKQLAEGDAIGRTLGPLARAALAPAAICGTYLAAIGSSGHDVYASRTRELRLPLLRSLAARQILRLR